MSVREVVRSDQAGFNLLYNGQVTDVGDKQDDSVIYTYIEGIDTNKKNPEKTYPLLPAKFFHALPQKMIEFL